MATVAIQVSRGEVSYVRGSGDHVFCSAATFALNAEMYNVALALAVILEDRPGRCFT